MKPKGISSIKVIKPPTRTRQVGVRLRQEDADALERLAAKEKVGLSTFARLVLEAYVSQHSTKR